MSEDTRPAAQSALDEGAPPASPRTHLTPEERAAFVQRIRDILTGKAPPPPLPEPPEVTRQLKGQALTEEGRKMMSEELTIQHRYPDAPIAALLLPDGSRRVLGYGDAEIDAIYLDIPLEERKDVVIVYPVHW
jgi:hypothetical protein